MGVRNVKREELVRLGSVAEHRTLSLPRVPNPAFPNRAWPFPISNTEASWS